MKTSDLRYRRPGGLALVVAGLALAFAVASGWSFWNTSRYADVSYLATLIETDRHVAVGEVHRIAAATDAIVDRDECRSDLVNAGMTVVLNDLDSRDPVADYDGWSAAIARADRYITHAVHCVPGNGNSWVRLAMVRQAVAENPEELSTLMSRSVWYAPSESGVIASRCVVWRKASEATLRLARPALDHDLILVLSYFPPAAATACLANASEPLKSIVVEEAKTLDPKRIATIRNGGVDWLPVLSAGS